MTKLSRTAWAAVVVLGGCVGQVGDGSTGAEGDTDEKAGTVRREAPAGASAAGIAPGAQPASAPSVAGAPSSCAPPSARIWKLTPSQYRRTVAALVPAAERLVDDLAGTLPSPNGELFTNAAEGLHMPGPHVAQLFSNARTIASAAVADRARLAPCLGAGAFDGACVRGFLEGFLARAFRRPATPGELAAYAGAFDRAAASGAPAALEDVLTAVFLAPSFLYRTELGPEDGARGAVALTPHERAAALSYTLADMPPDTELAAAAARRELETPEQLEAHARRLLASPERAVAPRALFDHQFPIERLATSRKDPKLFPEFTPQFAADMGREADLFVQQVLWKEDGRLATLMTANFTVVGGKLASVYGIKDAGPAFQKTMLPAGTRAGLLTQPGLLALLADERMADPVRRGSFVRARLLCQPPPPPPPNVDAVPPPPDGVRTQRERLAAHTADPSCAVCHRLIDPLGLAFETYDAIGRLRATEAGKPIDPSGEITDARVPRTRFTSAVDLADVLASSEQAGECFVRTVFRYVQGRAEGPGDACTLAAMTRRFGESRGRVLDLFAASAAEGALARTR